MDTPGILLTTQHTPIINLFLPFWVCFFSLALCVHVGNAEDWKLWFCLWPLSSRFCVFYTSASIFWRKTTLSPGIKSPSWTLGGFTTTAWKEMEMESHQPSSWSSLSAPGRPRAGHMQGPGCHTSPHSLSPTDFPHLQFEANEPSTY